MKKILLIAISSWTGTCNVQAQTPIGINYQAVIRDLSGVVLVQQTMTLDVRAIEGNMSGSQVFAETHVLTTSSQGVINTVIGSINDLSVVDWGSDEFFLEISLNGSFLGVTEILGLSFALHSTRADVTSSVDYSKISNAPGTSGWDANAADDFGGIYDRLVNIPALFDGKYSSLQNAPSIISSSQSSRLGLLIFFIPGKATHLTKSTTQFGYSSTQSFNSIVSHYI